MKKIITMIMVMGLAACEPQPDVSFWFADEPVLAEEMLERGWRMQDDILYLNNVEVFRWAQCMRCDHTVWLGPPTGGAQRIVIDQFNRDLKDAVRERDRRFFEAIRIEPSAGINSLAKPND